MKTIKYTVEIRGINNDGKEVVINTQGSSAQELQKNIKDVLSKSSKFTILKLLGLE